MTTMLRDEGPFYMRRLPYRLGFRWRGEYELQPGWKKATWDVPAWAGPSAGVIGSWSRRRTRLYYRRVPIGMWREDGPKFRSHKKRRNV